MKNLILLVLLILTLVYGFKAIEKINFNHAMNQQVENCSLYVGYCD